MLTQILNYLFPIVAVTGIIYHMVAVVYPLQSSTEHLNTHLAFALLLVFLEALRKNRKQWPVLLPLILLAVVVTGYVKISYWELENRLGSLSAMDLMIGILLILVVIEGCRRAMGWAVPIVVIAFLAYIFIGPYLPSSPFRIAKIDLPAIVNMLTFQFSGGAIYGLLLEVSAYFVIIFTIMGGVIQVTAAPILINNLGLLVGRRLQGGPALMSVVGSALVGTVTGVPTANIIVVGTFTIPLMKKVGFAPKEAGAIEAAASNGGQIMPPVMGAAAFVMAMMTGISYVTIMMAAVIPALLYFLSLGMYVQLLAMKKNIMPMTTLGGKADIRQMLLSLPAFVIPLAVIILLFVRGFSPMYVAFWGVVASFVMAIARPGKRLAWRECLEGFISGIMSGAVIAVSLAAIGIVTKIMTVTGLGVKLPTIVETLSGGNLALALLLVMLVCLVLGMGVPTTPAYILVAMIGAPVLVQLGVPLLAAHFFVFYYAVFALITPPVATAAIVSSRIAGATYISTGIEAVKIAAPSLLVPFIFIKNPVFLMQPGEGLVEGVAALAAGLLMVMCSSAAFNNYYVTRLNPLERALSVACVLFCLVYLVVMSNYLFLAIPIAIFAFLTLNQMRKCSRRRTAVVATN